MPSSDIGAADRSNMVPVRLRGHHFLCILTYRGHGYTPAFVGNMSAIVEQIGQGRPVILVEGPDDICHGFTADCRKICDHDCSLPSTAEMDLFASNAVSEILPLHHGEPFTLTRDHIAIMREAFARGAIRRACKECSWNEFCTGIAAQDFSGVKLFAPA